MNAAATTVSVVSAHTGRETSHSRLPFAARQVGNSSWLLRRSDDVSSFSDHLACMLGYQPRSWSTRHGICSPHRRLCEQFRNDMLKSCVEAHR